MFNNFILGVIFPIMLIVLILRSKKLNKVVKGILVVVLLIFYVSIGANRYKQVNAEAEVLFNQAKNAINQENYISANNYLQEIIHDYKGTKVEEKQRF